MVKRIINAIIAILLVIIGIVIPLVVHFKSGDITSEITADGMLGYISGYLSSLATIVLAIYAIWQTKQANDISQKYNDMTNQLLDIEKNNYKLQIRPFIAVSTYDVKKYTQSEIINSNEKIFIGVGKYDLGSDITGLTLTITNTTESFLMFSYYGAEKIDSDINWIHTSTGINNIKKRKTLLEPGKSQEIVFTANDEFILKHQGKRVKLCFILENRFAERYKETFTMIFTSVWKKDDNDIEATLFFQDYQIYKFEYNNDDIREVKEEL